MLFDLPVPFHFHMDPNAMDIGLEIASEHNFAAKIEMKISIHLLIARLIKNCNLF